MRAKVERDEINNCTIVRVTDDNGDESTLRIDNNQDEPISDNKSIKQPLNPLMALYLQSRRDYIFRHVKDDVV